MKEFWQHNPVLPSLPTKCLRYDKKVDEKTGDVNSKAIFLLETNEYLYCRFVGNVFYEDCGFVDFEINNWFKPILEIYEEY